MFTAKQRAILLGLGFTKRELYDSRLTYTWENFDYHGDGGEVVLRVGAKGRRRAGHNSTFASGAELPKFWASNATQGEAAIRSTSFPRLMAAIAELRLKM